MSSSTPSAAEGLVARSAWQGAAASLLLVFVGMPLELAMGRRLPGMPIWPPLVSMAAAALLWIPLGLGRHTRPLGVSRWVFLLNNAVIVVALWVTSARWAAAAPWWMPFQAHKLSVLTAAMFAPELWTGVIVIGLYTGAAALQLLGFSEPIRHNLAIGEPWAMIAFGAFSVVLLINRLKRQAMELALVQSRAEARALRRFARRLLAVRDLANTPLQTLEANTALLRTLQGAEIYADRMHRSLDRLREWQRILEADAVALSGEDELAFDAREVLDQRP